MVLCTSIKLLLFKVPLSNYCCSNFKILLRYSSDPHSLTAVISGCELNGLNIDYTGYSSLDIVLVGEVRQSFLISILRMPVSFPNNIPLAY